MTTSDGASGQPMADPDPAGSARPPSLSRNEPLSRSSGAAARPPSRTLQLVPPLSESLPPTGRHGAASEPDPPLQPALAPLPAADPALAAANRRLERELAEVQEEVGALEELLEELPAIFERKFQQRLVAVLEERRRLEADNRALRSQLRALAPGAADVPLQRLHGLLPPGSLGSPLQLERQEGGSGAADG
jgi:hypothetical protein